MMFSKVKWLLLITILIISACKNEERPSTAPPTVKRVEIPAFNGDNALSGIEKQLSFGFRVPGTAAHKDQIEWMAATMEQLGATVTRQDFRVDFLDQTDVECTNVMAQFNPTHPKC